MDPAARITKPFVMKKLLLVVFTLMTLAKIPAVNIMRKSLVHVNQLARKQAIAASTMTRFVGTTQVVVREHVVITMTLRHAHAACSAISLGTVVKMCVMSVGTTAKKSLRAALEYVVVTMMRNNAHVLHIVLLRVTAVTMPVTYVVVLHVVNNLLGARVFAAGTTRRRSAHVRLSVLTLETVVIMPVRSVVLLCVLMDLLDVKVSAVAIMKNSNAVVLQTVMSLAIVVAMHAMSVVETHVDLMDRKDVRAFAEAKTKMKAAIVMPHVLIMETVAKMLAMFVGLAMWSLLAARAFAEGSMTRRCVAAAMNVGTLEIAVKMAVRFVGALCACQRVAKASVEDTMMRINVVVTSYVTGLGTVVPTHVPSVELALSQDARHVVSTTRWINALVSSVVWIMATAVGQLVKSVASVFLSHFPVSKRVVWSYSTIQIPRMLMIFVPWLS